MGLRIGMVIKIGTTVLDTYILFRYMDIYFEKKKVNRCYLVLAYIFYWLCIDINAVGDIMPVIKTVLFNIGLVVLVACYFGSFGKKMLAVAVINLFSIIAENITFIIGNFYEDFLPFLEGEKLCVENVFCEVILGLEVFFARMIISSKDNKTKIPKRVLLLVMLILGVTLGINILFIEQTEEKGWLLILFTWLVVILSVLVIRYIQTIERIFEEEAKRRIFQQERLYYKKQLEWMEKKESEIRQIRHDMKNQFIVLEQMIEMGNVQKAKGYLQKAIGELRPEKIVETGNICVDSLINYKLCNTRKIEVIKKICIPENLTVSDEDMVVILGNLLDNAIEATEYLKDEEKKIWIILVEKKGMLFLHIKNTFDSTCLKKGGVLQTRKRNKTMHGLGLKSVQRVVERYGGIMKVEHVEHIFSVWIKIDLEK